METLNSKNYYDMYTKSLVNFKNLSNYAPIIESEGKTACIKGELSIISTRLSDNATRLVEQMIASCHGSPCGGFTGTSGTRFLIIDTVQGNPSLAAMRDNIKSLCSFNDDNLAVASMRDSSPSDILGAIDAVLERETGHDVIIVNNFSALVKTQSYRECQAVLTRLSTLAATRDVSIVLVAAPGFNISLTRPSRLASLFLCYCPHLIAESVPAKPSKGAAKQVAAEQADYPSLPFAAELPAVAIAVSEDQNKAAVPIKRPRPVPTRRKFIKIKKLKRHAPLSSVKIKLKRA